MLDFMSGLAKGIEKSKGMVAQAMEGVTADMVLNPKVGAVDYARVAGGSVTGTADTTGETEAGTVQRDVVRQGVVSISVSFSVSPVWLKKLTAFSKRNKIAVQYFDTEELELRETEMYIEGYKAKLMKDTSDKGLWMVSFMLKEF